MIVVRLRGPLSKTNVPVPKAFTLATVKPLTEGTLVAKSKPIFSVLVNPKVRSMPSCLTISRLTSATRTWRKTCWPPSTLSMLITFSSSSTKRRAIRRASSDALAERAVPVRTMSVFTAVTSMVSFGRILARAFLRAVMSTSTRTSRRSATRPSLSRKKTLVSPTAWATRKTFRAVLTTTSMISGLATMTSRASTGRLTRRVLPTDRVMT